MCVIVGQIKKFFESHLQLACALPAPEAAVAAGCRALPPRAPLGPGRARPRAAVLRLGGGTGTALWRGRSVPERGHFTSLI